MVEKLKKQVHSGKLAGYVIIMNFVAIAMTLVLTKVTDANSTLIKSIGFAVIGFIVNFFVCKYLLNKKYEITDGITEVKKKLFLSIFIVAVAFIAYGVISFNLDKNSRFIQVLPTLNYSEETKNMIYEKAKYNVSFGPPIKLFHASEATNKDIEKLEQDIKSEEEKIDNDLRENKISWIISITVYMGFSLIAILLVIYNLNRFIVSDEIIGTASQNVISKKVLVISILAILILVTIVISIFKGDIGNSNTTMDIDTALTGEKSMDVTLPLIQMLKVGDYIEYTPDSATYLTNTNNTGYYRSQKLEAGYENWRVFYIDEDSGLVFITKQTSIFSDSDAVTLKGIKGFLNGPTELNNICATLYSNKELGLIARNMTIEDVNKACGYTPSEEVDRYAYYPYGTDIDKMKSYIEYNGNNYISRVTDDKSWNYFYTCDAGGEKMTDSNGITYYKPTVDNPVLVTTKAMLYPISENEIVSKVLGRESGWLASSGTVAGIYGSAFGISVADSSGVSYVNITDVSGIGKDVSRVVRPIIALDSTIEIDNSDMTRDGKTYKTAWRIKKK